ncbi:PREDICTED: uncharacterized protein LOC107351885 [Acropora digitifera]|uniref:uncharacterized protein LOC107351885 n=1 Tax=Acropora digitifera TaxID=70779 RepID=UPI00077AA734|nr:PREDICTED: uncharacterized protein LOC107351885 [Acropora digitifera]
MNTLTSEEKKSCLRKKNREEELASLEAGGCNLYNILRLNMKDVRAMAKKEQDKEIKKAFHREIKIWHRYCNPDGDDDIAREVIMAYEILGNREKRARYNNMADYDSGWLSMRRFKAIFFPECETMAQRLAWIKRMWLLALTVGITVFGIGVVVLTAGFSSPFVVPAALGGVKALASIMSREAVLDGCSVKKWLLSTGIEYLIAFIPGGATIGLAALEDIAISAAEVIGIRTAVSSGSSLVAALVEDAKKKFVDGEDVTFKQALGHKIFQGAVAAGARLLGGAVSKGLQKAIQKTPATSLSDQAATEPISSVPNQTQRLPSEEVVVSALVEDAPETLCAKAAGAVEKLKAQDVAENKGSVEQISEYTKKELDAALNSTEKAKPTDGIIRYISKGYWFSKMIISYVDALNGENVTLERRGNGSQVTIPSTAERIEVRFKVLHPPWRDIQKYDRFQGCWCEPYEAHIFYYDTPPTRTFTIGGPLYSETVIKITDQYSSETEEM